MLFNCCNAQKKINKQNQIGDFHEGLAVFKDSITQKYGVIDSSGIVIIPAKFHQLENFYNGLAIERYNCKQYDDFSDCEKALINREGKNILPDSTRYYEDLTDKLILIYSRDGEGVINRRGEIIIPISYINITAIGSCLVIEKTEGDKNIMAFFDFNGNQLTPFRFKSNFSKSNLIIVTDINTLQMGLIDYSGKIILNTDYSKIEKTFERAFILYKDSKCGFTDDYGNVQIAPKYQFCYNEINNYAIVFDKGEHKIITRDNGEIISLGDSYSQISQVTDKIIIARKKEIYGGINFQKKLIIPFIYDYLRFNNNLILGKKNNKYGIIDLSNNIILPFEYDYNSLYIHPNYIEVNSNGKIAYYDLKGKRLSDSSHMINKK